MLFPSLAGERAVRPNTRGSVVRTAALSWAIGILHCKLAYRGTETLSKEL